MAARWRRPKIRNPIEDTQEELERARRAAEEAAKRAEEEARRRAEEAARKAEEARRAAEEAARRAEEEARRAAEQAARQAEDARRAAEEAARRTEEETRRAAEEATKRAEDEARRVAEEAARRAEEDARRAAEELQRQSIDQVRRVAHLASEPFPSSPNEFLKLFDDAARAPLEGQVALLATIAQENLEVASSFAQSVPGLREFLSDAAVLAGLMEVPTFIEFGVHFVGAPVYYVNGMWTPREHRNAQGEEDGAHEEARTLSEVLRRPVRLIYNKGTAYDGNGDDENIVGAIEDVREAIQDRVWPYWFKDHFTGASIEAVANAFRTGTAQLQHNPTTRQVAHLVFNADGPLSLVSYSQGCIITRNACHTAMLLNRTHIVPELVRWVAAGTPLNDNEVFPHPNKYTVLVERDDPAPKVSGLRGGGENALALNRAHHKWFKYYVEKVRVDMLWP